MPIYEYRCENGHTLEVLQRMSEDALASCTTCEAPVRRVFHPVAVHFKGSGFYATDYGNQPNGSEESKSNSGSDDSGKSSSDGSKDSKGASSKSEGSESKSKAGSSESKTSKSSGSS